LQAARLPPTLYKRRFCADAEASLDGARCDAKTDDNSMESRMGKRRGEDFGQLIQRARYG